MTEFILVVFFCTAGSSSGAVTIEKFSTEHDCVNAGKKLKQDIGRWTTNYSCVERTVYKP